MIHRAQKDSTHLFVQVSKEVLYRNDLSLKAKGLLATMLSYPDDWQFYESHLRTITKERRDGLRAAIKELIEHGYITRVRRRDDQGHFIYEYEVYELPIHDGFSVTGEPVTGEPVTGNTVYGKTTLTNNNSTNNNLTNNNPTKFTSTDATYFSLSGEDNAFLQSYLDIHQMYLGREHVRVNEEQKYRIDMCLDVIQNYYGLEMEQWIDKVDEHFNLLPESNNGNILAFFTACFRYFEIDLQRELSSVC